MTTARKRLGRETRVQELVTSGYLMPRSGLQRVPVPALKAFPYRSVALSGCSRRDTALQVVGRSNGHAAQNPGADSGCQPGPDEGRTSTYTDPVRAIRRERAGPIPCAL